MCIYHAINAGKTFLSEEARDSFRPEQAVRIGNTVYIKGGHVGGHLPSGKTWLRVPGGPAGGFTSPIGQLINITEPATLKTLLAHAAKGKEVYRGTTTFVQLWKTSTWFRSALPDKKPSAAKSRVKVDYKPYVDNRGLITRLVSSYDGKAADLAPARMSTDTVFSGWGRRVSIKPPAPARWRTSTSSAPTRTSCRFR